MLFDDRYVLLKLLGSGGFSDVHLAKDMHRKNQQVALKVYLRQDEEGIAMCRYEYDRTRSLNHPFIIKLSDFGVDTGRPYIVMPYYPQGTAQDRAGNFTEQEIWKLIIDIGQALHYLHNNSNPILHNDLKPNNILISEEGHYVLCDFGISDELHEKLSKSLEEDPEREHFVNGQTPLAYRAPELFNYKHVKKGPPIKATDIWAFGACLFELLTGEVPFGAQGGIQQLIGHWDKKLPVEQIIAVKLPDNISSNLKNLILRCLHIEPWSRPKAGEMVTIAHQNFREELFFNNQQFPTPDDSIYNNYHIKNEPELLDMAYNTSNSPKRRLLQRAVTITAIIIISIWISSIFLKFQGNSTSNIVHEPTKKIQITDTLTPTAVPTLNEKKSFPSPKDETGTNKKKSSTPIDRGPTDPPLSYFCINYTQTDYDDPTPSQVYQYLSNWGYPSQIGKRLIPSETKVVISKFDSRQDAQAFIRRFTRYRKSQRDSTIYIFDCQAIKN
jgi:serine/threonine protein kinase